MKNKIILVLSILVISLVTTNYFYNQKTRKHQKLIQKQAITIKSLQKNVKDLTTRHVQLLSSLEYISGVKVTMYNPLSAQTDSSPLITASGDKIDPNNASDHRWIAVSRDLHIRWGGKLSFGDIIYLKGTGSHDGVYVVKDTMNKRWTKRIDILKTKGYPSFKVDMAHIFLISESNAHLFTSVTQIAP